MNISRHDTTQAFTGSAEVRDCRDRWKQNINVTMNGDIRMAEIKNTKNEDIKDTINTDIIKLDIMNTQFVTNSQNSKYYTSNILTITTLYCTLLYRPVPGLAG